MGASDRLASRSTSLQAYLGVDRIVVNGREMGHASPQVARSWQSVVEVVDANVLSDSFGHLLNRQLLSVDHFH